MGNETGISLKKYKTKLIMAAIILVVVLIAIAAIFFKGYTDAKGKYEDIIQELREENARLSDPVAVYEMASKEVSVALIQSEIQDIGELATVEYLYTDAGKFEDPAKLFGKAIPFTTKSFIAKWDGTIKAGIDVNEIEVEVNQADREIIISLPKAKILSHEVHNDSIETLDERDGLFNPVKVDDVRQFDANSKNTMEARAIENGLLDKASENAKKIIYGLVNVGPVEKAEFTITFKEIA